MRKKRKIFNVLKYSMYIFILFSFQMNNKGKDNPVFLGDNDMSSVEIDTVKKGEDDSLDVDITNNSSDDDSEIIFEDKDFDGHIVGKLIERFWSTIQRQISHHGRIVKPILITR